jgi:hypothetical protein
MKNPFTVQEWIAWLSATAVAAFTMMAYGHNTFMTIREKLDIVERLDRIEDKIDSLLHGN